MMLDPPHTSAPMSMRGNALVLKTPVENAPRTSIEKHLSWSSDIPPAASFPLHQSRPAEYQPNRQPAAVCAESGAGEARRRVGRRRQLTVGNRSYKAPKEHIFNKGSIKRAELLDACRRFMATSGLQTCFTWPTQGVGESPVYR